MIPEPQTRIIEAIAETAAAWRDDDHPPRRSAAQKTLAAPNRVTEASLSYAFRHRLSGLTEEALAAWLRGAWVDAPQRVGIVAAGETPLDGLRDLVAVWGTGHRPQVALPASAPALLPAFAASVEERAPEATASFVQAETAEAETAEAETADMGALFDAVDAVIAQPSGDDPDACRQRCEAHDIPPAARHIRSAVVSVGVIDGHETEEEREDLAADMLLHEGKGRPRLALLWAPRDLSPDPYLEAMAQFRGAVPAHEDTPGALQMQQAFLEAQDVSHAYAAGLQFLVSRADPSVQPPGHVRWTEYDDREEATAWLREHEQRLYAVVAREDLHDALPPVAPILKPGEAHGAPIDDPEGEAVVDFLSALGAGVASRTEM